MEAVIVWFRQDLRLLDNPALYHAALESKNIIPIYIYEEDMPWSLGGAQQWWLHHSLLALQEQFKKNNIKLILKRGKSQDVLLKICQEYSISAVYWNRCYEPAVINRDTQIKKTLTELGIKVQIYNSSLLHEPWEISNKQNSYFKIFTPFWRKCSAMPVMEKIFPIPKMMQKIMLDSDVLDSWQLLPTQPDWSSGLNSKWQPGELQAQKRLHKFMNELLLNYSKARDFPALDSTSTLSPYLHFGEISIKKIFNEIKLMEVHEKNALPACEHFLKELVWREFSYYLLYHFPQLAEKNFQKKFDNFPWSYDQRLLIAWQKGQTGYPLVDAGMRELWHTGYMHNRVRMIVASFLTKHLLIDWREGEKWFWDTLVDADLANNAMNWQWVAGCGVDAAPYYRIFNPVLQGEKFDTKGEYVRHWVPELAKLPDKYIHQPWKAPLDILQSAGIILGKHYPKPVVDHEMARKRALEIYKKLKT